MAAPTIVSSPVTNAETSNDTNHVLNKPGVADGDLLILVACLDTFTPGTGVTLTKPSEIANELYANQAVNADDSIAVGSVWYDTAGASEPSTYTWTSSAAERGAGLVFAINGHNGIDVSAPSANTGSSDTITFPAVTTTVADCLILRIAIFDAGMVSVNLGSGYTLVGEADASSAGGVHAQYITQASAGTTGTLAVTGATSEQWAAWTVAIAPVGGATRKRIHITHT